MWWRFPWLGVVAGGCALAHSPDLLYGIVGRVAAAFGTALLLAAIYRVGAVRRLAMELMHRITGQ